MVDAATVKALADRLAKAEALVAAGKVHAISGLEGYYAVESSTGAGMYLVHLTADGACCSCPDFKIRGKERGEACKHIFGAQLVAATPPDPAPTKRTKTATPQADARPQTDPKAALAMLQGDNEDPYPMRAA